MTLSRAVDMVRDALGRHSNERLPVSECVAAVVEELTRTTSVLEAAQHRIQKDDELFSWLLGEHPTDEFPSLPEDWPSRKFYWRKALRDRLARVLGEQK